MKDPLSDLERARTVIRSACMMLMDSRTHEPVFVQDVDGLDEDFAVLLRDAVRMFCRAVSSQHGEPPGSRWAPGLSEALLAHPEQCDVALARVEKGAASEALDLVCTSA